jgi:tetratricopeptide (TPR) repeat protein
MDVDGIVELEQWADELRTKLSLARVIDEIKARMREADDNENYQLVLILKNVLIEAGREQEAARIIDEMVTRLPNDVRFPIAKASLYLYFLKNLEEALESINEALARAHRTGFFRREALGVKARILLELGLGEQLSQVLEEIMSLEMRHGVPDVGRERDFVDRAPPGMILEDVLARYNVFCPRRDGR